MDDTAFNNRSLPLDWNGSLNPGQLNEITMGTRLECTEGGIGGLPLFHRQSLEQMSPIRGRTMKEYDQQIVELKNENFNLKLRIYFLEERLQQKFTDSSDDIHKFNIDLKIEVENLKKELNNKHELLMKASKALESMEATNKAEMNEINSKFASLKCDLEEEIDSLKQKLSIREKGNGVTQDELYQQAFASLVTLDSAMKEKSTETEEIEINLGQLQEELLSSHNRIQELEKCLSDKDTHIKEVEITTVKTHKFVQGIMNAIRDKEKQLKQVQEQCEIQAIELKETKEALNGYLKKAAEIKDPVFTAELPETTDNKQNEITRQLELTINERQEVINNCLKLLGIIDVEVYNCSSSAILSMFKLKLVEREEKTESLIKEKCKVLKERDNELMLYQEKLQETENQLKMTLISVEELNVELRKRENEIDKLNSAIRSFGNPALSDRENEKHKFNEDIIGRLKDYMELLVDDLTPKKAIEQEREVIREILSRSFSNKVKSHYFEEKLSDLEDIILANVAKMKLLENQLSSVQDRMSLLRNLVDSIQNGNTKEENLEVNTTLDLEENMQVILRGIKVMANLNSLFCSHIKLNNELLSKSQMVINISDNLNCLKCAQCMSLITNEFSDKIPSSLEKSASSGCNGEELLKAMVLLRSDYLKIIDSLKQKVSSTESNVFLLGAKVKYRKLLRDNADVGIASKSCRCMSVDDLLLTQKTSVLFGKRARALSADNILYEDKGCALKCNTFDNSPCTPDSLLAYGQTSDVLELKEQVCRLKLVLEQRECQLNEMYSEGEMCRSESLAKSYYLSNLHSYMKEQTLSPSKCNLLTDFIPEIKKTETSNGDVRTVFEANIGNNGNELQWLRRMNAMTQSQLEALINEIPNGKYLSFIQLQQHDISMLQNRLLESLDACELLRIRLEELAEFMEHLLRFDENGFLDVRLFTPQRLELLKRQIAESRELTHTISHSLLVDTDLSNVTDSTMGRVILEESEMNNYIEHNKKCCTLKDEIIHNEMCSNSSMNVNYLQNKREEPRKLVQSSCDDLILLLKPNQSNEPKEMTNREREIQIQNVVSESSNEIRALDAFKEQAIIAEYGRYYRSRQYADCSDGRHTYRRMVHTLSHNVEVVSDLPRLEYCPTGDLSPSDSESWSEPDRNVSQQRIGLELDKQECFKSKLNFSSSNVDSMSEDSNSISAQRFGNERLQIKNLQRRLQNEIEVNKCLRSELKLANTLEKYNGENYKGDKENLEKHICNDRKRPIGGNKVRAILSDHLLEIRSLRLRLEESIQVNDLLREKLEKLLKTRQQNVHRNEGEIDRLVIELEEKEHTLNELDLQIRSYLSQCNKQKGFEMETEELHQQLADLTEKLQLSSVHIQQLDIELISRDECIRLLKDANLRLQSSIIHMQTALIGKEGIVKELREANMHMQITLETVDNLHKQHEMELEIKENEKKNELEAWKIRERELTEELEKMKEETDRFSTQFEELKIAIAHTEEQLEKEHGLRLSAQKQSNEMEIILSTYKELANGLKSHLNECDVKLKVESEKTGKLQQVVVEREQMIVKFKDTVSKLEEENLAKTALIEKKLASFAALELQMDAVNKKMSQENGMSSKVMGMEKQLMELQKMLKEKIRSSPKRENEYEQLQVMLDERSTAIRKLEDELKRVVKENEKLQHQSFFSFESLKEAKDLNSSLKTELAFYEQFHSNGLFKTLLLPTSRRCVQGLSCGINADGLLSEMRRLRTQLELGIQTNNALREELKGKYLVKSGENSITVTRQQDTHSWCDLPIALSQSNFTMKKYASYPCGRRDILSTEMNQIQQQSQCLSDYVCEDSTSYSVCQKSDKKCDPKFRLKIVASTEPTISDQLVDSHSVYSSPDLGIESDPSHCSSLEKRITNITEEHLQEIRSLHQCEKNLRRISADKLSKQNAKSPSSNQLVFAIGSVNDYDLLKKDLENNVTILLGLQNRVKERIQCSSRTSVKNSEYMTLKEMEKKIDSLIIGLGKSLKLVSCFWKSMLNSSPVTEAKNTSLLEENLILKKKLDKQKIILQEALSKLADSSRLKEGMEKAIMKQLTKTHDVLKRAKGNLEDQANNPKSMCLIEKM